MKLTSVDAYGVLGEYHHHFEFTDGAAFSIIYGPNGVGKTKLLELLDAALKLDVTRLASLPFESASIRFDDGSELSILASPSEVDEPADSEDEHDGVDLEIKFTMHTGDFLPWSVPGVSPRGSRGFRAWLRESSWRQVAESMWEDQSDGELINYDELQRRYGGNSFVSGVPRRKRGNDHEAPPELQEALAAPRVHLIETQRLRITTQDARNPRRSANSTVVAYSEDIRKQVSGALAQNSRRTQQLDRSFPRRLLDEDQRPEADVDDIRQKYEDQSSVRDRLAQIAVVGIEEDFALPTRELKDWEKTVLWMYLGDTDVKLESFGPILEKIDVLEDILNRRFLRKTLHVNAEDGLAVAATDTGRRLSLESLSSGEQHELILMYQLLFVVEPGSLVLIDEPEISLHVSWQIAFLADVARIASLSDFQFVVATHSPQIISDEWGHAFQLGPESE